MSDPRGSKVSLQNGGGFCGKFSVGWNNSTGYNETDNSDDYCNPNSKQIDLMPYHSNGKINTGDSCWLIWHMDGGPNHNSGDNFTFDAQSDSNISYTITGGVLTPSFHQQG
jgi:hypothetical protein